MAISWILTADMLAFIADSNTRVLTVGIDDITRSDLAKVSILKATT